MVSTRKPYELIYWPEIPGRAEHVRLCFEEAGVPFVDLSTGDTQKAVQEVTMLMNPENMGSLDNPPGFAPPFLRHGDLIISQTPNTLAYLAPMLGLNPGVNGAESAGRVSLHLNQLVLTALDGLSNEVHNTHHPISTSLYYEDQKDFAILRAKHYREEVLPKFLDYFERVLAAPTSLADAPWLYGSERTYADLVLFQCIDGVKFAFPKAIARLLSSRKYERLVRHYDAVRERPNIKAYLDSERKKKFTVGIYRQYPELDDQ